jgi:hypothetical protein
MLTWPNGKALFGRGGTPSDRAQGLRYVGENPR